MIVRTIEKRLNDALGSDLSIVLYGARQVGKTTLLRSVTKNKPNTLFLTADDPETRDGLANISLNRLKLDYGQYECIVIDEAQLVPNIGLVGKLIHDNMAGTKLILSGSSSFDLSNSINEPMTGRTYELFLTPLSLSEVSQTVDTITPSVIERMMIIGTYPGVWTRPLNDAKKRLDTLARQYIYKDTFQRELQFNPRLLDEIVTLLAHQVGSEVSYTEIGNKVGVTKDTVKRYIYLLEQAFIVFRVYQHRKNQRNEVGRLRKVYFWDLGIRNALIGDLRPLTSRTDVGALWENLMFIERKKLLLEQGEYLSTHRYWRDNTKQEIDMIELSASGEKAFEFKYSKERKSAPVAFTRAYPDAPFATVTLHNYKPFLSS